MHKRVALIGRSGVGKSTCAEFLGSQGYQNCSTGGICRDISNILFGNEDRSNLNSITDALQNLDKSIFLKSALRLMDLEGAIVIDSLRYKEDYQFAIENGFTIVRIRANSADQSHRLLLRGQKYSPGKDDNHSSETELVTAPADIEIPNTKSLSVFRGAIGDHLNLGRRK